ncbi:MAG TPA: Crp/Fnr family transcriptional regulator [Thermoanaerobaculia bacterium]|jgi:CRP-like cAMP-binding protein|nr:Crp/Fnr family transcriptional regulator [Thermoanaerobaculia bacterium]
MYSINTSAPLPTPSLRDVFDRHTVGATRTRLDGQKPIYAIGDEDDSMYLIESGQVKLSMASEEGKDCLLAIYGEGELFGESCFHGTGRRTETATTMRFTIVRRASRREFVAEVERSHVVDALLRHLAHRLGERQNAVFDLITNDSEQRLAKVLLAVAEKLGRPDGPLLRLEQHISHEELSQFVGTTRPRITAFMQRFRTLGLVHTAGRSISINCQRIRAFLAHE